LTKCRLGAQKNPGLINSKAYQKLHNFHRAGLYQQARVNYHLRKERAVAANRHRPGSHASIVTDGGDTANNRMPYLAQNKELSHPLKQHLQVVKDHTRGKEFIYRSVDNIPKGANLTIHSLASFLEDWYKEYGR
jgi:hypothetical protein